MSVTIGLVKSDRYELIEGNPIWICDRRFPERNPLFALRGSDGEFAKRFLRALNSQPEGGESTVHESRPLTAVGQ